MGRVNSAGEDISQLSTPDDASRLQTQLKLLNTRWANVCQQLNERKRRCVRVYVLLWLQVMYNPCLSYFQMSLKVNFYETSLFLICPWMKICLQAFDNWSLTVTTDILCNGGQWKGKWRLVEMPNWWACQLFNYYISWLVTLHCVTSVRLNCVEFSCKHDKNQFAFNAKVTLVTLVLWGAWQISATKEYHDTPMGEDETPTPP